MDVLKLFKHLESSLSRAGARLSHIPLFLVSFFVLLRAVFSLSLLILFGAVVPQGATAAGVTSSQPNLKQDVTREHNLEWEAEGVMRSQV